MVAQATRCDFWASRQLAQARGISLKRDPALLMLLFLRPRLGGGGGSLERDPSAWARCWARQCCNWMSVCSWMICFGWVWLYDEWYVYKGIWGMFGMIHELRMTGWVWYWHMKWMSGLELKGHVFNMRWGPRFMGWWWSEVWIRNMMRMRN